MQSAIVAIGFSSPVNGADFYEVSQSVRIMIRLILPVNKTAFVHLQSDSSVVAVNCVQAGDGKEQGGEQRRQRWIHYR